ncbi:MAG: hypothetical protein ABH821_04305 [archaeon]
MRKGQISLDFMLALIAVLIFVYLMQGIFSSNIETQDVLTIRSQQEVIANKVASLIASSQALDETSLGNTFTGSISFMIPRITSMNGTAIVCSVEFIGEEVVVSSTVNDLSVESSVKLNLRDEFRLELPGNKSCGEEIEIIINETGVQIT